MDYNKCISNSGGVYENPALTSAVEQHPSTNRYCKELEEYMRNQLSKHKGDVGMLEDKKVYWKIEGRPVLAKDSKEDIRNGKVFSFTPQYDGGVKSGEKRKNLFDGVGIALGDIWATEISILDYQLHNDDRYKLTYQVTLLDHFGLNKEDLKWFFHCIQILVMVSYRGFFFNIFMDTSPLLLVLFLNVHLEKK